MKRTSVIIVLLTLMLKGYSQENYTQEEGKVTQYEMSMKEYEKDKDAEALVVYDLGDYYFQGDILNGLLLHMTKHIKIKILKQAGVEYASFEIPYYMEGRDWESIEYIEGTTFNYENGELSKTALTSKNIFEEKVNNNISVKKVTFADVREGSVVELKYKIVTPYFYHMREWQFQRKIPVVYSQLKYKAIPYYEYAYLVKGTETFDVQTSELLNDNKQFGRFTYKEKEFTFGKKDIPAFRDELYVTSANDYMMAIKFQLAKYTLPTGGSQELITTWSAMSDDFLKDDRFGKFIKNSKKESKKILETLDIADKTPIQKVEVIADYVKNNYFWDGFYGKYASDKLSSLLKQKTGNIGSLNLFLIGLLEGAEIEVYPIVLSTRGHGLISISAPFTQSFNYVIAMAVVDGKPIYIDASEPLLYYNSLPPRCINVEGLVIKPKSEEWTQMFQRRNSLEQKEFKITINSEKKEANVGAVFFGTDYEAYNYRKIYMGKEDNLIKHLKDKNNIDVKNGVKVVQNDKLNRPFVFSFDFSSLIESSADKLFIHPYFNISISDNPFKQKERKLPVDLMFIQGEIYKSKLEIPEGYKVEYMPESYMEDNDVVKIDYVCQKHDNIIETNAYYTLKRNMYNASDYERLKQSFAEIIKRFSEMIVLVKE
ncbi:DUF3857 domain-containing protein [Dysgonomonas sp. Marseille-P4361]|uniref:DUF3857 domain-containing protein n=1 Tax=Dysgonomonas sp. Marseille-P4361 TaxID=2161820 RepID=UPI000D54C8AB|nr:DUF3857 domain-containing protein [Dysgonomonas sp. Marseille-P4361]